MKETDLVDELVRITIERLRADGVVLSIGTARNVEVSLREVFGGKRIRYVPREPSPSSSPIGSAPPR